MLTLSHLAIDNLYMNGIKDGATIERDEIPKIEKIGNIEEELSLEKHSRVESQNRAASQHFT